MLRRAALPPPPLNPPCGGGARMSAGRGLKVPVSSRRRQGQNASGAGPKGSLLRPERAGPGRERGGA